MSGGHPTAPQKKALRLIGTRGPLDADRLGRHLARAWHTGGNPAPTPAAARLADTLAWRPAAQGLITGTGDTWSTTADGRRLVSCSGGRA
ncbi:hypothetical protein [Planomonospora parontospora]|uniref:hypothetical protein n=1 Tax=Planomonospora parontospora TaxID=58119 RepID=UPI0016705574|nr:hypothetical protein [Planomonospora parontospora]GGL46911.1 hypothetical protein GCM10014719_55300 [Planomonospora parontospora subsp. antibiotica]GII20256.1 hypothetical protein Ppa05_69820 [Planomonospora parontospora subsp. antibiotica]